MQTHPIIIVEDDVDDCDMLVSALQSIGVKNKLHCFTSPLPAIEYLNSTEETPFIIISDINMPLMNGLKFKQVINENRTISTKQIPFVFLSTSRDSNYLNQAFHLSIQGYFKKPNDYKALVGIAKAIMDYWKHSTFHETMN